MTLDVPLISVYAFSVQKLAPLNPKSRVIAVSDVFTNVTSVLAAVYQPSSYPISEKIQTLYKNKNKEELEKYSKILYNEARLIEGLPIENPTELATLVCDILSK